MTSWWAGVPGSALNRGSTTGDLSVVTQPNPERGGEPEFEAILAEWTWPGLAGVPAENKALKLQKTPADVGPAETL